MRKHAEQAGGIVVNDMRQIAVVRNNMGRWTFPEGSQEAGEQLEETARREIQQETGIRQAEIHQKLGTIIRQGFIYPDTDTPVRKKIHMFFCTTSQRDLKPELPDAVDAKWAWPEEVKDILSWPEEVAFYEANHDKLGL